ncbi:hypothetical protein [Jiangella rhizosphaerae]|uniref:Uncharacterized protein n=1 Tax=Jiangella rhizosphaerae TaxID=2293569 RepID=A0A418KTG2_9ACTN|nr:hypothetical protein [Jiangella rhizosphaerae]RIQ28160.1 hypothetical protein DY240_09290 [Jiangella rhizosphaerae]
MTPEQQQTLDDIIAVYRRSAPAGWLRIVCRWECELESDGLPSSALAHVVIVDDGGTLTQVQFPTPDDLTFVLDDFHAELARETSSGKLTVDLLIDRDTYDLTVTEEPSKMLHGDWTDSRERVHQYLDRHRDELTALASGQ